MSQIFNKDVAVNITVSTMEFFQWYTGLKTKDEIEEELFFQDVVWRQENNGEPISREELVEFLDNEQITINSYYETEQDTELTINNDYLVIIADGCPFVPVLNH